MSASKYTEGYKDALHAVFEVLEELVQDSFIDEEVVPIIRRAIELELQPRNRGKNYETRP